jgi:hypothetical protein
MFHHEAERGAGKPGALRRQNLFQLAAHIIAAEEIIERGAGKAHGKIRCLFRRLFHIEHDERGQMGNELAGADVASRRQGSRALTLAAPIGHERAKACIDRLGHRIDIQFERFELQRLNHQNSLGT